MPGPEPNSAGTGATRERERAVGVEEVVQLPVGERSYVWTVLHHPASPPAASVLLCAPFGSEKVKAHRTLVALARELAAQGLLVARFDHRGEGDSGGDFEDFGWEDRRQDALAVLRRLADRSGDLPWAGVGLRLGATLLAQVAARPEAPGPPRAAPLCLWAPVRDVRSYLVRQLRANVVAQGLRQGRVVEETPQLVERLEQGGTVLVDGFPLTGRLFTECGSQRLDAVARQHAGPLLLLDIDRKARPRPAGWLRKLADALPTCRAATVACHSRFWLDFRYHCPAEPSLFDTTQAFLQELIDGHR